MISKVQWSREGQDRLVWVRDDQHVYTVKSGYNVLNKEDQMLNPEVLQMLWSLKIAPSALVCVWRIVLDRLPTRANLVRRRVQLGNAWCSLCWEGTENAQHLFSTYKVAQRVWHSCKRWVRSVVVRHESVPIRFQSFYLTGYRNSVNRV